MDKKFSSNYSNVVNGAKAIVIRPIHYYMKDTELSTLVVYAAIKIVVLLGAILVSMLFQPSVLLRNHAPRRPKT